MRAKETKELIESLGDYKFTITECAKSLEDYVQIVKDQDDEILTLKNRVAELEESCENMNEVEMNLHTKIEKLQGCLDYKQIEINLLRNEFKNLEGKQ